MTEKPHLRGEFDETEMKEVSYQEKQQKFVNSSRLLLFFHFAGDPRRAFFPPYKSQTGARQ